MKAIITGVITDIFQTVTLGQMFRKRVFRVKQIDVERNPQHWELECHFEEIALLDKLSTGDEVTCDIIILGREYTKMGQTAIYNTLKCVDISYKGSIGKKSIGVRSTRSQTSGIPHKNPVKRTPPKRDEGYGEVDR